MKFIMMYHDEKIAAIEIDKDRLKEGEKFVIEYKTYNDMLLPFAIKQAITERKLEEFEAWFKHRIIPSYRKNIGLLAKELKSYPAAWTVKAHGASLTDGYWIRKEREKVTWKEVSCFDKKFDYSIGNLTFGLTSGRYNYNTPDITTAGAMPKTWRFKDGRTYLIKYGSAPDYLEPYNEKLATEILKRVCPVPFVTYDLVLIKGHVCSICENFMSPDLELVTAADLARTDIRPSYLTTNMYIRERCKSFGIPDHKTFLDYLHFADYIIDNKDRNLGNYGFLYSPGKCEFLGPAPIYDNGASFWTSDYPDIPSLDVHAEKNKAKELLTDLSGHFAPSLEALGDIADIAGQLYEQAPISDKAVKKITENLNFKLDVFEHEYERSKRHHRHEHEQEQDLER